MARESRLIPLRDCTTVLAVVSEPPVSPPEPTSEEAGAQVSHPPGADSEVGPGLRNAPIPGERAAHSPAENPEPAPTVSTETAPPPSGTEAISNAPKISLPTWEGPLDLLLQLIQKHELNILDIPIAFVTEKYLEYLALMRELSIDVASEYLVMAATLLHIKSKMLLPDLPSAAGEVEGEEEEEDPRGELIRRLLEYQKYKAAAEDLGRRETLGKDVFPRGANEPVEEGPAPFAQIGTFQLLEAFAKILERTKSKIEHEVVFDRISISDRIAELTEALKGRRNSPFEELFTRPDRAPSRFDLIITFLAVLEMARLRMMRVYQSESLSSIFVELLVVDDDDAEGVSETHE